ncbi:8199_t:CDS:2 [Ambispora gerdemannii]|uniref:8199_t:CDS:1 n=1 Tax=Ambispora gerdemannii TaxID=144530 RepID=A0A9N9CP24_9GLOM|nr:8199_t:CDS:2 [Ambispora gerdemannii]
MAIYLIGLIYTIPKSHEVPRRHYSYNRQLNYEQSRGVWVPRPAIVDAFGFFVLLGPIVSLNTFAILSGFFLDRGNKNLSTILIRIHYISWSFFCWILICGILYFGKQLTSILVKHIEDTKEAGRATPLKVNRLEYGLKKLKYVLYLLLLTLLFFAITSLLFACFREFLLTYSPFLSHMLATFWVLIVPVVNVVIVTVLAHEISNKEESVHILRQSTFASRYLHTMPPNHHSHRSSHFKSENFLSTISKTDAPNSIYHKPNVTSSIGRISPIQLPAMYGEDSKISEANIDSRCQTESNSQIRLEYPTIYPLAPVHLLSPIPQDMSSNQYQPQFLALGFRKDTSNETVTFASLGADGQLVNEFAECLVIDAL